MTDLVQRSANYDWLCEGCGAMGHDEDSAEEHREACSMARHSTTQVWFEIRDA